MFGEVAQQEVVRLGRPPHGCGRREGARASRATEGGRNVPNENTPGVDYHMVLSAVRVTGSRTTTVDSAPEPPTTVEEAEATVDLVEIADPTFHYGIGLDGGWTKDVTLELTFTEDLRITATGTTSKGRVGDAVKGTLKFVVSTVATVAGLAVKGAEVRAARADERPAVEQTSAAEVYARDRREADALRKKTAAAIAEVRAALVENDARFATIEKPGELRDAARRSTALREALARLESEYAAMEARFDAWKASRRDTFTATFEYVVPVEHLPAASDVDAKLDHPDEALLGPCWRMYRDLHTVVAVQDLWGVKDDSDIDPNVGNEYTGIFFRKPREVELSVYERVVTGGNSAAIRLTQKSRHLVVDDRCERRFVKFERSAWGDRAVAVSFGALGGPEKVSSSATSVAASVGQVLGDIPATVKDALEQGAAAVDSLDKLRNAGLARELARVQKESDVLKQRVANDVAGADGAALRELEDLKRRKEVLTLQKDIGDLSAPPEPARAAPAPASGRKVVVTIDGEPTG
jgi:hypothetical protein